jgi:lysyl-tRNA synthetase class I
MQNATVVENNQMETLTQLELKNVEEMTNELKRLLVKNEKALDEHDTRHEVEVIERWMESYRRGLSAAHKLSETGTTWLVDLRDKLKLAADELIRLEGEGGNPSNKEQVERTEELLNAVRRIDKVLPEMQHMFNPAKIEESEEA